jgi:hypothetical protein
VKRDMDLIRKILLAVEESAGEARIPEIDGYTAVEIAYHSRLLLDAELITALDASSHDGEAYLITGFTWSGHDFLDASRNDTVWNKAKDIIKIKGGAFTFEILKSLLTKLVSEQVLGP